MIKSYSLTEETVDAIKALQDRLPLGTTASKVVALAINELLESVGKSTEPLHYEDPESPRLPEKPWFNVHQQQLPNQTAHGGCENHGKNVVYCPDCVIAIISNGILANAPNIDGLISAVKPTTSGS